MAEMATLADGSDISKHFLSILLKFGFFRLSKNAPSPSQEQKICFGQVRWFPSNNGICFPLREKRGGLKHQSTEAPSVN